MIPPNQVQALNQIIEEGNAIETFLTTQAWEIIKRTARAQLENYRAECYDAAKDSTKNLGNFLGRMEGIEWLLDTIEHSFVQSMKQAIATRKMEEEVAIESRDLDTTVTAHFNTPIIQMKPGTI